jgi:hypothetical protein
MALASLWNVAILSYFIPHVKTWYIYCSICLSFPAFLSLISDQFLIQHEPANSWVPCSVPTTYHIPYSHEDSVTGSGHNLQQGLNCSFLVIWTFPFFSSIISSTWCISKPAWTIQSYGVVGWTRGTSLVLVDKIFEVIITSLYFLVSLHIDRSDTSVQI